MFEKVILNNNIPVLMETSREFHSMCLGLWIKVGARNESSRKNGISHFLEHMFFKGTNRRSAQDIAAEIDSLGGELNAFTSSEYTVFYVKVLAEYMEKAVDLLTDIFLQSTFPEEDIEKEKKIVIEEIKMVEDNPADYIHDLFNKSIWGEEGLGQSVLGKRETIKSFTRQDLLDHISKYYGIENIVVACSGNFSTKKLIKNLNRTIGCLKRNVVNKKERPPKFMSRLNVVTRRLAETHLCLGIQGLPYKSEERYTMHLLNTILGAGYSSRLFQNIREKKGLVYSIYSYHAAYFDTGVWIVYAGTDKKNVREVVNIMIDEITNLSNTVTHDELQRAKAQLKGNLILALESTSNKMTNIAKQEIYYGKYFPPEEIIKIVDSITIENVKALAHRLIGKNAFALTVYGPVKKTELKTLVPGY
jgi:predicted Zn-dependent peptidase